MSAKPFPWRMGVHVSLGGQFTGRVGVVVSAPPFPGVTLDVPGVGLVGLGEWDQPLDTGPTRGALLDAVREAYGEPHLATRYTGAAWVVDWPRWLHRAPISTGPTEYAALLAAWNAAPVPTPESPQEADVPDR